MLIQYWFNLPRQVRFIFVGGINAVTSYLLYSIYCLVFDINSYQIALIFSWVLSSFISFTLQKYLVFQSKGKWLNEYLKCLSTWFFSYLINAVLLEFFVKIVYINIFIAQIISTGLTAVFTYIVFKQFAFKKSL